MIHKIVEVLYQYLLQHFQISNQDVWCRPNVESTEQQN